VIVGTGAFRTGLQDPPPLIMGQGQGRGCDVGLSAAAKNKRTLLGNEHVVDVEFSGTIACSGVPGITGTSEARLVDLSAPLADISGGASGTSGTSSKTVTYRESGRGGRKVKAVYSGRTEAPPGRTWDGCVGRDFETSRTLFTQCQVNGNVITWQAEAPFPDFVGDGAMLDTGLPPERNCQLRPEPPTVVDGKLRATGIGSCDEPIRSITVDAKLSGTYIDDQGVERTVDLRAAGTDEDRDGRADAVIEATCQPGNQQRVTYTLNVTARFRHPDLPPESGWPSQAGWEQGPSFLESERGGVECVPVP
jgi:hypothetical protein